MKRIKTWWDIYSSEVFGEKWLLVKPENKIFHTEYGERTDAIYNKFPEHWVWDFSGVRKYVFHIGKTERAVSAMNLQTYYVLQESI